MRASNDCVRKYCTASSQNAEIECFMFYRDNQAPPTYAAAVTLQTQRQVYLCCCWLQCIAGLQLHVGVAGRKFQEQPDDPDSRFVLGDQKQHGTHKPVLGSPRLVAICWL